MNMSNAWVVECLRRKPYCDDDNILNLVMNLKVRVYISFSKIFENDESKKLGDNYPSHLYYQI